MITFDKRDAIDTARVEIAENPDAGLPVVGFRARFKQAYDSFVNESLSSSRRTAYQAKFQEQVELAESVGESIRNPYDLEEIKAVEFGRDMTAAFVQGQQRDFENKIKSLQEKYPDVGFKNSDQLLEDIKSEAAELREIDRVGGINSTGSGSLGSALGVMAGAVSDPVVLLSLPFGGGASGQSLNWAQRVGRTALIEAGIGVVAETAIQPGVYQYKQEIESPYTISDAATNVLAAGAGGFFFGGLFQGGSDLYKSIRKSNPNRKQTQDDKVAEDILDQHKEINDSNPYSNDIEGQGLHAENIRENAQTVVDGNPIESVKSQETKASPKSNELMLFDPDDLEVDAKRFQFKSGGDSQGVSSRLKGVEEFDPRLAGVALVYEDEAGKRFIVDGHQRLGLAKRAKANGQENVQLTAFVMRQADDFTDSEARAVAAFKNIAEGTGSAVDAAKLLREVGERGLPVLPPSSVLVKNARGLAQLSDDAFGAVVNGIIPENYGAIVGRLVEDPELQLAIVDVVKKLNPKTLDETESLVRQGILAGASKEGQQGLFDDSILSESLLMERAQLLGGAVSTLKKDRNLFKTLTKDSDTIKGAGNKLDEQSNIKRLNENDRIIQEIQAKAHTKGELSDTIQQLAEKVKSGEIKLSAAQRDLVESIRRSSDQFVSNGDSPSPSRSDKKADAQTDGRKVAARAQFEALQKNEAENVSDDLFRETTKEPDLNFDEFEVPIGETIDPDTGARVTEVISAREVMERANRVQKSADAMEACIRA